MKKYIFDDNTKLVFIKGNLILVQNKEFKAKEKLDSSFYNRLLVCRAHEKVIISSSEMFSDNEIKFLKKNKIIKDLSIIMEKYLNTQYEKYQLFLESIFPSSLKVDYIRNNELQRILFIGAGGICTGIIDNLVSVGCINFGIVDFDYVDITNFNRQFKYGSEDIGCLKVCALKRNLERQYSGLKISAFNKKINSSFDLDMIIDEYKPNFVICAADTPILLIQKYIVETCEKYNIACIFGGVGISAGSIGPLLFEKKGRKKYLNELNKVLQSVEGLFPCKGSYGVTNSLVSNYMARDIINFLMNNKKQVISLNKKCEIDFDRCEMYEKGKY